jgi:glycosyltransferase involved in cell wall biosynthesis/phospholipid N-methyltransferase
MTSLSVLVPVYNEQHLVATSLARLQVLTSSPSLQRIQVIVVDDCSTDDTPNVLARFREQTARSDGRIEWTFLKHEKNGGKGAAIQTALAKADCEIAVIHDADLEYHPKDLIRIVQVFEDEGADAVFGSRFAGGDVRCVLNYRHELGNRLLTFLTNVVTNLNITDMETCYKAVRTELLKSIPIDSNDFRLEVELTVKLAKRKARIFEVPISYSGRTYQEGKKINWRDGFRALFAIVRFAMSDHVYATDEFGTQTLARLSGATRFSAWMADVIAPHCGRRVLEIGAGTGTITRHLVPREKYVASDINPIHLRELEKLRSGRPYLTVSYVDAEKSDTYPDTGDFDTVVCLNVVEHVDDHAALTSMSRVLAPGGRAVILVPQGQWNFGSLDELLGHRCRYSRKTLGAAAERAGLKVSTMYTFNRASSIPWFVNGRILRRRQFGAMQVRMVDLMVPMLRVVDKALPLPALSLIAVLERPNSGASAAT